MIRWLQRHSLLVITLFAYCAMTTMLLYQERVIDTQRTLIRQLFSDNMELTARKIHDIQNTQNKKADVRP